MDKPFVALAGSERQVVPGARLVGPADPHEEIEVTIVLRPRVPIEARTAPARLTRAEFARTEGARPADIRRAEAFAAAFDLRVARTSPAERTVVLAGSAGAFARAFGVELGRFEIDGATYRGREGPIHLPVDLAGVVIAVLGLDDRLAAERR